MQLWQITYLGAGAEVEKKNISLKIENIFKKIKI